MERSERNIKLDQRVEAFTIKYGFKFHPPIIKLCVRCGYDRLYTSDIERCGGCGAYVPACYEPMKNCFVAIVKDTKDLHRPPSNADIAYRWIGVTFWSGDFNFYFKSTMESFERLAKKSRELEAKFPCNCEKCKTKIPIDYSGDGDIIRRQL